MPSTVIRFLTLTDSGSPLSGGREGLADHAKGGERKSAGVERKAAGVERKAAGDERKQ